MSTRPPPPEARPGPDLGITRMSVSFEDAYLALFAAIFRHMRTAMRFILPLLALFCLGLPRALASAPCEGWQALDCWKAGPSLEDVRFCLSAAPQITRYDQGATPLHFAARSSRTPAILSALLDAGGRAQRETNPEAAIECAGRRQQGKVKNRGGQKAPAPFTHPSSAHL